MLSARLTRQPLQPTHFDISVESRFTFIIRTKNDNKKITRMLAFKTGDKGIPLRKVLQDA